MTARKGYRCNHCGQAETVHAEAPCGDVFLCADGSVGVFRHVRSSPKRPSQSFSGGEVNLLADIFDSLHIESRPAQGFARHPDMTSLARKVIGMKQKLLRRQLEGDPHAREDS